LNKLRIKNFKSNNKNRSPFTVYRQKDNEKMIRISSIKQFILPCLMLLLAFGGSNIAFAQFKVSKTCIPECPDSTSATIFKDTITTSKATAWKWDFGDVTSGAKNTSKLKTTAHLYTTPGVKTVTLTRTVNGLPVVTTQTITINNPPKPFFLGNAPEQQDTTICKGDFLTLDPYKGGGDPKYKYIWYPKGDTTQTLRADTTSCYSVQVTDSTTGCSAQNKINVKLCVPPPPKPPENYWYFGNNAGIKFSGGSASADDKGKIDTKEGVSSIADANGNLLFYTDGRKIYDKNGKELASLKPDALAGSEVSTQSAVIVPQPSCQGCQSLYYVFTTTDINGTKQLSYSVVDIRQNKGQGKVIEKNVILDDEASTEQVISHFVKKDSTYWVISHDYGNDTIRLRRVTKNGVSISKVVAIGSKLDSLFKGEGYLKVSQDGTKLAVAIPGGVRNLVEVYDFADSTGEITNKRIIDLGPAPPKLYGVEFSPDSKTMFVTLQADTLKNSTSYSSLLRFDLTDKDSTVIAKSKVLIDSSRKDIYGSVQLGPDGRIYLAVAGSTFLGLIKTPNDTLKYNKTTGKIDTAYYERNGFNLNGKTSQLGLPTTYNITSENNEGVGISASDTCLGSPSNFQTSHLCGDKLKNLKTDWRFYKGDIPKDGNPVGSPVASIQGGEGDKGLKATYTFTEPGKYYVVVNMGNRCKPDTMLPPQPFEILPLPKPDLGLDLNLCAKTTTLDSKVTLDSINYFWFQNKKFLPKDRLKTLTVTQSGNYAVLVEARGCLGLDTIKVVLAQAKALNLGPDTLICTGESIVLDASSAAGTGTTYSWSTGATTSSISATTPGKYIVKVKTPIGTTFCETADTVNVKLRPKPSFITTPTLPSACKSNDGKIQLTLTPSGTYTFIWSKDGVALAGQTTASITGLTTGSYKAIISSPFTCQVTSSTILNSSATPTAQITTKPLPVTCISDGGINIEVLATSKFRPINFILRQRDNNDAIISKGAMSSIFVLTGKYAIKGLFTGTYYLEFTDNDGCKFISNDVILNKIPRVDVKIGTTPPPVCEGQIVTLTAINNDSGTILWSTGSTIFSTDVTKTGVYTVTVTSLDGKCKSSEKVAVTFKPSPKVNITSPSKFCFTPKSVQLVGTPAGGVWQGPNVNLEGMFKVPTFGVYQVRYEVNQNGCPGFYIQDITVQDAPVIDLGTDKNICRNDNTNNTIGVNNLVGTSYRWNTGENTPKIAPNRSGSYILTATKGLCQAADTIAITLKPSPVLSLKSEIPLCVPDKLPVRLNAGGGAGLTYKWRPNGETAQLISVSTIGIYSVEATNSFGCKTPAQTTVVDRCEPSILVPDIFTPNGDALNNNFEVFTSHIKEYNLKIYNRWGELIFTAKTPEDRWDGKYKGIPVKPDSFAWIITYVPEYFPERGLQSKEGAVTVAW
jgi:gliding motility-associated-like protein